MIHDELPDIIRKHVAPTGACWLWTGTFCNGVPYLKNGSARRAVWAAAYGERPTQGQLHVTCGNASCINPEHLVLRTPIGRKAGDIAARFWPKVDQSAGPDACWPWTAFKDPKGYGRFMVRSSSSQAAHRHAWELTNGPIPEGLQVCHHCDNPPCCNPKHLFIGTSQQNTADRDAKGRATHGVDIWTATLTERQVLAIREAYARGEVASQLAEKYDVCRDAIFAIVRFEHWAHIGGPAYRPHKRGLEGSSHKMAKLDEDSVRKIRRLRRDGFKLREIARMFGVSLTTVSDVATGRLWAQVADEVAA